MIRTLISLTLAASLLIAPAVAETNTETMADYQTPASVWRRLSLARAWRAWCVVARSMLLTAFVTLAWASCGGGDDTPPLTPGSCRSDAIFEFGTRTDDFKLAQLARHRFVLRCCLW